MKIYQLKKLDITWKERKNRPKQRPGKIDFMVTSSNGNIFRVTGLLCGEFTGHRWIAPPQRPVTRSFDVIFDQTMETSVIETPSRRLWRHYNVLAIVGGRIIVTPSRWDAEITWKTICHERPHISRVFFFQVSRFITDLLQWSRASL